VIACPVCGGPTDVRETRDVGPTRTRRRRYCKAIACAGRVTTIEVPISDESKGRRGALAIVPRDALEDVQRAIESAIAVAGDA